MKRAALAIFLSLFAAANSFAEKISFDAEKSLTV